MFVVKYKGISIEVLVDEEFLPDILKYKWYLSGGYIVRNKLKEDNHSTKLISLHKEILKLSGHEIPRKKVVDHINRNKLDNRLLNLRIVSYGENNINISEKELKNKKQRMRSIAKLGLNRGSKHAKSKKVIDSESGVIYTCIREAAEAWNINYSTLKYQLQNPSHNKTSLNYLDN